MVKYDDKIKKNSLLEAQGSKIRLAVIILFTLFLVSFINAEIVTDTFSTPTSSISVTGYSGGSFAPITDVLVYNFTISTDATAASNFYLFYPNGTLISNITIVGGLAEFIAPIGLKANVSYFAVVNNLGANYNKRYETGNTYNQTKTNVFITGGCNGDLSIPCLASDVLANILTITTNVTTLSEESNIINNLTLPSNNSVINIENTTLKSNLSILGVNLSYSWKNITWNTWFSNGTLFNNTLRTGLSGNNTNVTLSLTGITLGTYYWNTYACYANATYSNCSWGNNGNFTFSLGSSVNAVIYNAVTYETSNEDFIINFTLLAGAELSTAQLIYNGTTYAISNISASGNYYLLERRIDIPLNVNSSLNQTNEFYIKFTYSGSSTQTFGPYEQNSSFINLVQCGGAYTVQALNFTFWDEYNQKQIDSTNNKTSIAASFKYWIGNGNIYKNYSFQNLSSTTNNYQFCISPYASNITFKADMGMEFSADTYRDNSYSLKNSTLTNISSDIFLYLLPSDIATKFYLTFKNGINLVSQGTITVQKYFVGLGEFQTVAILTSDNDGKTAMWQDIDKTYRYSIIQNGVLLGTIDKVSICAAAPCSLTIMVEQSIDTAFDYYDEYYAQNVLSNISFNKTSQIATYTFIDTTGLARYFRFEVKQSKLNQDGVTICNVTSYSSAGTLSCNLTGYTGDFVASGYISRSPEKLDKFIAILIDADVIKGLGTTGLLIVLVILVTIVVAAAVISKGNPSTVLFMLGFAILGLKLINILPFSWVVVVTMEVLIIFMIFKVKT